MTAIFVFGLIGFAKGATTVNLGTANDFTILAGTPNITNVPTSVISGNVGLSPATGAGIGLTAAQVTGTIYAVDGAGPAGAVNDPGLLTTAKNDLTTAYTDAAGRTPVTTVATELGGTTKTAGVYDSTSGTFGITGTLTLDAQGDPNAVFIFKTATTLITQSSSIVVLINDAQACKVFWQVGSSATLGTNSVFKGNILALTSITLTTGANVEGRLLARNGTVILDTNTVTKAVCASPTAATLHIIKTVINNDGGTTAASGFNLHVKLSGTDVTGSPAVGIVSPGTLYSLTAAGTYVVSEDANASYSNSFSGDCDSSGNVSLALGDNKTCTIMNDDIATIAATTPSSPAAVASSTSSSATTTSAATTSTASSSASTPGFPKTGAPTDNTSNPWAIILISSITFSVLAYYILRKKQSKSF